MLQGVLVVLQEDVQSYPEVGVKHNMTNVAGLSTGQSASTSYVLHCEPDKMIGMQEDKNNGISHALVFLKYFLKVLARLA